MRRIVLKYASWPALLPLVGMQFIILPECPVIYKFILRKILHELWQNADGIAYVFNCLFIYFLIYSHILIPQNDIHLQPYKYDACKSHVSRNINILLINREPLKIQRNKSDGNNDFSCSVSTRRTATMKSFPVSG